MNPIRSLIENVIIEMMLAYATIIGGYNRERERERGNCHGYYECMLQDIVPMCTTFVPVL